ncbi:MAG TPA: MupA/Atu3671 family FMN-dependent luciferase-like monooxygenase [Streptomyces sp.]|nr:MupA/Atu3671 family FMN-dependent luciferase-like monooxygenase [Streptomyces sp.]
MSNGTSPDSPERRLTGKQLAAYRALLAQRERKRAGGRFAVPRIDVEADRLYPLTSTQERIWFEELYGQAGSAYTVFASYRIRGALDADLLSRALDRVVDDTDALRTRITVRDGVPAQAVAAPGTTGPVLRRTTSIAPDDDFFTEIRIDDERLVKAELTRVAADEHILRLGVHHVLLDGESLKLVLQQLWRHYEASDTAPSAQKPVGSVEFALWEKDFTASDAYDDELSYWKDRLAGGSEAHWEPRPDRSARPWRRAVPVEGELAEAVTLAASAAGVGAATFFLAATSLAVARVQDRSDITMGVPFANRRHPDLDGAVGCLFNVLLVRVRPTRDLTSVALLAQASEALAGALDHGSAPLSAVARQRPASGERRGAPLFDTQFAFAGEGGDGEAAPGLTIEELDAPHLGAQASVTVRVRQDEGRFLLEVEADATAVDETTFDALCRAVASACRHLVGGGATPAEALEGELRESAAARLPNTVSTGELPLLPGLIEEWIRRTPDATAIEDRFGASLSYAALGRAATALAVRLVELGVGYGSPVAVEIAERASFPVALLGVFWAGGTAVPVEREPAARREAILQDSGAAVYVVTDRRATGAGHGPAGGLPVVDVDLDPPLPTPDSAFRAGPQRPLRGAAPAYILYTSGSTGRPKGVVVSQRALATFGDGFARVVEVGPGDKVLGITNPSFDIAMLELVWSLGQGAHLCLGTRPTASGRLRHKAPDLGLMFFGNDEGADNAGAYRQLLAETAAADRAGFRAVWLPERHYSQFGGLFPSPAVAGAAVAATTERIEIRSGSVVLPLHDPISVAEEWSMVDGISGGRVGLSLASGWSPRDFTLVPERYQDRRELLHKGIHELRELWRAGRGRTRGDREPDGLHLFPTPTQDDVPLWLTAAGSVETFSLAAELGVGLLTHMLGQDYDELAQKIDVYKREWFARGNPGLPRVVLMMHSFVPGAGEDLSPVMPYLRKYLESSINLAVSGGSTAEVAERDREVVIDRAVARLLDGRSLIGAEDDCARALGLAASAGVDEVACLIDFLPSHLRDASMVDRLTAARERAAESPAQKPSGGEFIPSGVVLAQATPTVAALLLGAEDEQVLSGIKTWILGGERVPDDVVERVFAAGGERVAVVYGPTEATIWATASVRESAGSTPSIGSALPHYRVHILTADGSLADHGVVGEICIGGDAVADGYCGRPAETAKAFGPDPYSTTPGARLYRTGDFGRQLPNGEIEFIGRRDHQIKLNGHRIELGEIESAVRRVPGVATAAVAVVGTANRRLAAFVEPVLASDAPTEEAVRKRLAEELPSYMVPVEIRVQARFPLLPSGKIDRKALIASITRATPEVKQQSAPAAQVAAPEAHAAAAPIPLPAETDDPVVDSVRTVWAQTLERAAAHDHEDFFDVGGHSLLAVQMLRRLNDAWLVDIPLSEFFNNPTVSWLVSTVRDGLSNSDIESFLSELTKDEEQQT